MSNKSFIIVLVLACPTITTAAAGVRFNYLDKTPTPKANEQYIACAGEDCEESTMQNEQELEEGTEKAEPSQSDATHYDLPEEESTQDHRTRKPRTNKQPPSTETSSFPVQVCEPSTLRRKYETHEVREKHVTTTTDTYYDTGRTESGRLTLAQ